MFHDTTPTGPPRRDNTSTATSVVIPTREETKSPYSIVGSIDEPGLGLISWWNQ